MRNWMTALAAVAIVALPRANAGWPQDDEKDGASEEEAQDAGDEEDDSEARWFAVTGDIYTGLGGVLRDTTLVAKNGVIQEIGRDPYIPEGAEILDARGSRVYPGLVAIESSGLFGASSDLDDSADPYEDMMTLALAGGITTAVQGNEVGKLSRGKLEGMVIQSKVFATLPFGSANSRRDLRERLEEAAEYVREYRQWQVDVRSDKDLEEPKAPKDRTAVEVLRGDVLARFRGNERSELLEIARLAQQYGFRPVIDGCTEGWTVADELGRAGAFAIVTPRARRTKSEELVREGGSSIENAAILHRSGVQVALIPASTNISLGGIAGRDLMHLPIEVGFAVRGGMPEQAALEAITIVPARMLRVDHRVGSLEVGKDCDLIVTDGDLLHYQTFVQWAVVGGEIVYDKQDELYFAHIRPRPESSLAPEEEVHAEESQEQPVPAEDDSGDED